jgi:site-specific DNA-methyltransferase (adenine-specific)
MIINQEFKNLIPPLSEDEYNQLEQNCIAEGIRDSLVTWQGTLIDGHNRYEIATKHNLPYKTIEKEFDNENEVIEWIIYNQFGRRNLSNYQRSLLALKLKPMFEEKAKGKQLSTLKQNTVSQISDEREEINTKKELAKIAGVSHDTIAKVQKIEQEAAPEVKQKLLIGEMTINKAYKDIKTNEKRNERINLTKKITLSEKYKQNFILGDSIEELKKINDNSVDCVITDPPYGINYISNHRQIDNGISKKIQNDNIESALLLWDETCKILINKTKKDAHLYIFTSWKVWHLFREITEKYYKIKNCLIWEKNNWSMGDLQGNYAEKYEMIIFATNGNKELLGSRDQNILKFDRVSNHKLIHSCEKPIDLIKYLLQKSTLENEMVIDPFAGSGSTLLSCKKMNRNFWGCELDEQNYNKGLERLQNE